MTTIVRFDDTYFRDPHAAAARWAAAAPIHRFVSDSGTEGWLITGYELARTALVDPAIAKNPDTMIGGTARPDSVAARLRRAAARQVTTHMLGTDPPGHSRLRGSVAEAFTPRAVEALEPWLDNRAAHLVDDMDPGSPVDIVTALAFPLPIGLLCHILSLPERHLDRIGRASSVLSDVLVADPDELRVAAIDFTRFILPRLIGRAVRPREDLLGAVAAQMRRRELSISEALSTIALLLIAGHETTTSLIASTVYRLLHHPGELDRVHDDPARLDAVIDETLRHDPPLPATTLRVAHEPLQLAGQDIRPGEWIMVSLLAAHHDPALHVTAETFDPGRKPNRHLAFGYGVHYCLGARLARLETRIALRRLLDRYPKLALAAESDPVWRRSVTFRRLEHLSVRLEPR
ncbi:putative cytochrome P450 [Nocardia nova SH22a]|uniref:Putative cytochrome P450 n=1 Tax=Nocardia nova SH22a TaxID=1415166 RepID=W5TQE2_9NOCA|nr:cytochrome P450 [Nocardia nova]AHH21462.1 putative cytochrome P450 [Nocardia nova SH22a]